MNFLFDYQKELCWRSEVRNDRRIADAFLKLAADVALPLSFFAVAFAFNRFITIRRFSRFIKKSFAHANFECAGT